MLDFLDTMWIRFKYKWDTFTQRVYRFFFWGWRFKHLNTWDNTYWHDLNAIYLREVCRDWKKMLEGGWVHVGAEKTYKDLLTLQKAFEMRTESEQEWPLCPKERRKAGDIDLVFRERDVKILYSGDENLWRRINAFDTKHQEERRALSQDLLKKYMFKPTVLNFWW